MMEARDDLLNCPFCRTVWTVEEYEQAIQDLPINITQRAVTLGYCPSCVRADCKD